MPRMRTLPVDSDLLDRVELAARKLDGIDDDARKFKRRSGRSRIANSEVAHRAIELGLERILADDEITGV